MKHLILVVLFFGWTSILLYGQELKVNGQLISSETGDPISFVQIQLLGTTSGTQTDFEGRFELTVKNLPCRLQLSHVAYKDKTILVESPTVFSLLDPLVSTLPEISVTATFTPDTLLKEKLYHVTDYDFVNDYLIMLTYPTNQRKSQLILLGPDKEEIHALPVRNGRSLEKICLGNIYLKTDKTAFSISIKENKLILSDSMPAEQFTETLMPCLIATPLHFIYSLYPQDLHLVYYGIHRENEEKKIIADISNETEKVRELDDQRMSAQINAAVHASEASAAFDQMFRKKILYKKLDLPIVALQDRLLVFNYLSNQILIYTLEGDPQDFTLIDYHQRKDWKGQFFQDEVNDEIYEGFTGKHGELDIERVNLSTGETTKVITIPEAYPLEIKVRDGWVYYIHEKLGNGINKRLLRRLPLNE